MLGSDHRELDGLLSEVFSAISDGDIERTFQKLDLFWARLAMHIRAEHLHLFPALVALYPAADKVPDTLPNILDDLRDDHNYFMRELAGSIKLLRSLAAVQQSDPPAELGSIEQTLIVLRDRLTAHNEIEESQIYALAVDVPEPADGPDLEALINKELTNLPQRFKGNSDADHLR